MLVVSDTYIFQSSVSNLKIFVYWGIPLYSNVKVSIFNCFVIINHGVLMLQPLILLANEGTDTGRIQAAHALAKIAITQNPEIAFPGQRVCASQNSISVLEVYRFIQDLVSVF